MAGGARVRGSEVLVHDLKLAGHNYRLDDCSGFRTKALGIIFCFDLAVTQSLIVGVTW